MIGELNVGHAYVNGGDLPKPTRIPLGLLGAEFSRDQSGYYKIENILEGANWSKVLRSPLTETGVNVKEGEFIISIDGKDLSKVTDMYQLLIGKADKQVELRVNSKPGLSGSRKVIVVPIASEADLYYYNWVQGNIKKVNEATNGEVGYLHIPDMGVGGLNEFAKYFYPQLHKKALIIDDRGNGGGNVSPMIIERLQRQIQRANMARNVEIPSQTPRQMLNGPIVVLVNQYSASDGDLFPYGIKHYGIGKVIGVRTWGGVVGIRGTLPFIDGAILNRPEYASYDPVTGEWIIEGRGVEPDIVIDNDPYEEFMGKDTQLNKAIEVILEDMKNFPKIHPIPQGPDKSGKQN
jgi:tricorn protease